MSMNMKNLLAVAQKNHSIIPAFNIGSDQLLKVVTKEVKKLNSPVILETNLGEFNFIRDARIQATIYEEAQTDVPACIHPGHGDSYKTAVRVIRAGMTSVMTDASTLPYEENAAVTKKVAETVYIANASAESELGTVGTTGNSIEGGTRGVIYAVPEETKQFIEDTGTDTFAAVIDAAYGTYLKDTELELRIDILKSITSKADVSLVLHDESSNKDEEIAAVVDSGICKINISSDIKVAFYTQCRKTLNENPGYREPLEIYPETVEVCGEAIGERIRLFKPNDRVKYHCQDHKQFLIRMKRDWFKRRNQSFSYNKAIGKRVVMTGFLHGYT